MDHAGASECPAPRCLAMCGAREAHPLDASSPFTTNSRIGAGGGCSGHACPKHAPAALRWPPPAPNMNSRVRACSSGAGPLYRALCVEMEELLARHTPSADDRHKRNHVSSQDTEFFLRSTLAAAHMGQGRMRRGGGGAELAACTVLYCWPASQPAPCHALCALPAWRWLQVLLGLAKAVRFIWADRHPSMHLFGSAVTGLGTM